MVSVVEEVVDDGEFLELFPNYAENIIIGFARLDGRSIGVVGNSQTSSLVVWTLTPRSSARFIRLCDAFNIPLVTFEDVPGFLPGVVQEWGGIIRHGAKLLSLCRSNRSETHIWSLESLRRRYLAMSCKHLQSDYNVAWPTANSPLWEQRVL